MTPQRCGQLWLAYSVRIFWKTVIIFWEGGTILAGFILKSYIKLELTSDRLRSFVRFRSLRAAMCYCRIFRAVPSTDGCIVCGNR